MECIIAEIYLHKKKWALLGIYHPPSQCQSRFYQELGKAMDHLSETFENFLILGTSIEEDDHKIGTFFHAPGLKNLIKAATCFKSNENRKCFSNT